MGDVTTPYGSLAAFGAFLEPDPDDKRMACGFKRFQARPVLNFVREQGVPLPPDPNTNDQYTGKAFLGCSLGVS
jgi:hypothetical protein